MAYLTYNNEQQVQINGRAYGAVAQGPHILFIFFLSSFTYM